VIADVRDELERELVLDAARFDHLTRKMRASTCEPWLAGFV
jgi:hypothetical protein